MYFIGMLVVVVIVYIMKDIAKVEKVPFRTEMGKLFVSTIIVFVSVYSAQYLNNQSQNKRDIKHAVNVLYLASNEIQGLNDFLKRTPDEYRKAKNESGGTYKVKEFFYDNPMEIPPVVEAALSDTNILRVMHPQSADSIYVAFSNSKHALNTINSRDLKSNQLGKAVSQASVFLDSLKTFIEYEIQYQTGKVSEELFFEMHIKFNEKTNHHTQSTRYDLDH